MTALLVQEDPNARRLWRAALTDRGHEVVETDCLDEAQARLDRDPDILLLDLCLGLRSGLTLARNAARDRPDRHFILLTGAAQHDRIRLARRVPQNSILLCKPVDVERMAAELDTIRAPRVKTA